MPDITMCMNAVCPSSKECYRHMALAKPIAQSFAMFMVEDGEERCEHFMEIDWRKIRGEDK